MYSEQAKAAAARRHRPRPWLRRIAEDEIRFAGRASQTCATLFFPLIIRLPLYIDPNQQSSHRSAAEFTLN